MMFQSTKIIGLGGMLLLCVSGCSFDSDQSDLKAYIAEVKARPQGNIEPLPPVRTYEAYVYSATAKRSPFDPPVQTQQVIGTRNPDLKPDLTREKEFLESFNLDALSMVGSLEQRGTQWVLIRDNAGGIHRVTIGNYLGKNHGRIVSVSAAQVDLVEIVSDGLGGWVQRPRSIKLSEKE